MKEVIAERDRLNATAVVMGNPKAVKKWMDAAPGHVIPGTSFDSTDADDGLRKCPLSARFLIPSNHWNRRRPLPGTINLQ
jgi:hypothetical protein